MKKYKKVISVISISCIFAGVIFAALWFMGIIDPVQAGKEGKDRETADNPLKAETDKAENIAEELWQIVFKGFEFSIEPKGLAMIHESGCLNIRSCGEYLIQLDVEDKTAAEFWENKEEKTDNIEKAGYCIQQPPQKTDINGREYISYIVSLANERGSDYENSYFYVLISEAPGERRFLATVRFDGIDIASLDTKERAVYYEKALKEAADVIDSALPTDKSEDAAGTYWEKKPSGDYRSQDSLFCDEITISYQLPEGYCLISDNEAGKTYYSEEDQTHVTVSVIPYSWINAKAMAERKGSAGISKAVTEGEWEINGVYYQYYTYSVMYREEEEKSYSYHFHAYADLKNGDIYSLHGFTDKNAEVMNKEYFYDFMNIEETKKDR